MIYIDIYSMNNNNELKKMIKIAELKHEWMQIEKHELNKSLYMILDTRFGTIPFSVYKHSLTESELMEELKRFV